MSQQLVDRMEQVWRSIDELCSSLDDAEWKTETDCPGWAVQDQVSHLAGNESGILGRPAPDHEPSDVSHTKNPIGESNEVQVDYRRSWSPQEVLDDFREVTGERLKQLRAMSDEDFQAESWTPIGQGTVADFLGIRIFDAWVHEQDIRRATDRPGHLDGPVAEHALERIAGAMPFVVGKKVGPPDGTTVVLEVIGPVAETIPVGISGGRGERLSDVPDDPTVRLRMDLATFNRLGCGRGDPSALASDVEIAGDEDLGRRICEQMSFMI